jgi:hypothetical protein
MATQPNLPQYQLSKLPDMLAANMQQVNAAAVAAMTNLGTRLAKQKEERKKLIKEGDAIEANFNDFFANKEKSGVIDADAANREWAGKAARNLNDLYIKAYGSNGTLADREAYKEAKSRAMEDVNNLGTFASLVGMNNKAIESDLKARNQGTSVGRLTNNSLTGSYKKWYNRTTEINNGTATNYKVSRDANGHQILTYNLLNTNGKGLQQENGKDIVRTVDVNAWVNEFNKTGKGLDALTVKPEQSLQTGVAANFKKKYLDTKLLNPAVTKVVSKYDKQTKSHIKTKVLDYEAFDKQLETDTNLNAQLESDTKLSSFPQTFFELQNEGYNKDYVGNALPLADQPWMVGNTVSDKQLEEFNKIDELTLKDPTPSDDLTREDLNTIQRNSAKKMLANFYTTQTPIGEVTTAESDVERYQKTVDGKDYTAGQKTKFMNMRPAYNAINKAFDNKVWVDKTDHQKGLKISTLDEYADLINSIEKTKAGSGNVVKNLYKTGEWLNNNNYGTNDPNKLYAVVMDNKGGISKVYPSNFALEDLQGDPEDLYQQILAENNLDNTVTSWLDANLKP